MPSNPLRLTVVIRDEAPVRHLNEPCTYRSVHVVLTAEQIDLLTLRHADEFVATSFLEPADAG